MTLSAVAITVRTIRVYRSIRIGTSGSILVPSTCVESEIRLGQYVLAAGLERLFDPWHWLGRHIVETRTDTVDRGCGALRFSLVGV